MESGFQAGRVGIRADVFPYVAMAAHVHSSRYQEDATGHNRLVVVAVIFLGSGTAWRASLRGIAARNLATLLTKQPARNSELKQRNAHFLSRSNELTVQARQW